MLETLSTRDMVAAARLPFWNEVARTLAPIHVEAAEPSWFEGRMRRRRCRELELASIDSSAARIASTRDLDSACALNLQLQVQGRSLATTGGRSCELEAGDFTLYDPAQPLSVTFDQPTQIIVVRLPLALAEDRLPHLRRMAGIRISGRTGPGAAVSAFLRTLWDEMEQDDRGWAEAIDDVIWPMLDLAYASERAAAAEPGRRDERRRAVFATIDAHLLDPGLDACLIGRKLGVSTRYVQILFAEIATTPSAYIQQRRLERAARELTEGRAAITDVAFDVGFSDLSSFCRAFRRHFDVSPREYRAGVRRDRPLNS